MTTVTTTAPTGSITCGSCSRVAVAAAVGTELKGWITEPPLVVQGVRIGKCLACRTGQAPPAEGERTCDGSCKGDYRPARGTYYEAVWGDTWRGRGEKHACWDEGCVETWAEEQDSECFHCGHDVDVEVHKYVDGKRVRS